jgi:hypothetical protein
VIEALLAPGSQPFAVALLLMLGLLLIELAALVTGLGVNDLVDELVVPRTGLETAGDAATGMEATGAAGTHTPLSRLLAWLYVGRVPVLMLLIAFLTLFGLAGLLLQATLLKTVGFALPAVVAGPVVLALTLPLLRGSAALLERVLPRDETSAVHPSSFVGHTALVVGGDARRDLPAQARLVDAFGTGHYVLVVPEDHGAVLPAGTRVLLVRKLGGGRFGAIANPSAALEEA